MRRLARWRFEIIEQDPAKHPGIGRHIGYVDGTGETIGEAMTDALKTLQSDPRWVPGLTTFGLRVKRQWR
jgi:hypothetical protein